MFSFFKKLRAVDDDADMRRIEEQLVSVGLQRILVQQELLRLNQLAGKDTGVSDQRKVEEACNELAKSIVKIIRYNAGKR